MRRFDEPPKSGIYYRPRPGAYGMFFKHGKILLTRQNYAPAQEFDAIPEWQLPGGGVEKGELFRPALAREVMEETGWKVSIGRKITIYRRFVFMPDYGFHAEKICHIYLGRALYQHGAPCEPHHIGKLVEINFALGKIANQADRALLFAATQM